MDIVSILAIGSNPSCPAILRLNKEHNLYQHIPIYGSFRLRGWVIMFISIWMMTRANIIAPPTKEVFQTITINP